MSKYNIYIFFLNVNESYETRMKKMQKSEEKRKIPRSRRGI